jgi:hypothetical protein
VVAGPRPVGHLLEPAQVCKSWAWPLVVCCKIQAKPECSTASRFRGYQ